MAERGGVRVTLSVERAPLPAGQRTWAAVVIENRSPGVILWQGGGCEIPATITIELASPVRPDPGRDWPGLAGRLKGLIAPPVEATQSTAFLPEAFVDAQQPMACPADLAINELAPGARIEHRAAWDGDILGVAAPAGPATLKASFPFMGPNLPGIDKFAAPLQPIEASATVPVVDAGVRLISPAVAVDAALADGRFAQWVNALPMTEWQGVDMQVRNGTYVVSLAVTKGGVRVAAQVTVDRRTGAVLGYEEVDR